LINLGQILISFKRLTNLKTLSISGNLIDDLTSLNVINGLTSLSIESNNISDISPLAGFGNLI